MKSITRVISLLLLAAFLLPLQAISFAADSTSFDPTKIPIVAKSSGGVPVGTVVAWPVATNPADMDKWLECNGQTISSTVYPEL
ncbi:MAG: phage tail protein, partial [Desulfovibrio sp.]|nr:phage tail protein [Desulfovibrio sp.]